MKSLILLILSACTMAAQVILPTSTTIQGQVLVTSSGNVTGAGDTNAWQIEVTTTASPQDFSVSLTSPNTLSVDWGDGGAQDNYTSSGTKTHSYATSGVYTQRFSGSAAQISFNAGTPHLVTRILSPVVNVSGLSSFSSTFRSCTNLIGSIPTNLFDACAGVTTFASCFYDCMRLTNVIPATLFWSNQIATSFAFTFRGCSNLIGSLTADFFRYNTNADSFGSSFYFCFGLTGSLPVDFFRYNIRATDFSLVFFECQNLTGAIPTDSFRYNTNATTFQMTFYGTRKMSGSLPTDLFRYNWRNTSFYSTFTHSFGVSGAIPVDFFRYNTNVVICQNTFYETQVTSIPTGLFDYVTLCTNFQGTFHDCTNLTSIPPLLFDKTTNVFTYADCFLAAGAFLSGHTPTNSAGLKLWQLTLPTPVGTDCFDGQTGLSDYASVPAGWK